jgi:hypothetical protein
MNRILKLEYVFLALFMIQFVSCNKSSNQPVKPERFHKAVGQLTETMVHDIFSPPVSSRIYVYSCIAAYEAAVPGFPKYKSLSGQLNGLTAPPKPKPNEEYNYEVASLEAFSIVASKLVFSSDKILQNQEEKIKEMEQLGISKDILERSKAYGKEVANHIIEWASKDHYKETRTAGAYPISNKEGVWKPTPPAYMPGIEPHWNSIRTFVLDSASQFSPPAPTPYSMDKKSQFYKEMMEVYNTGINLSKTDIAIAKFWDCNPFALETKGHMMFAAKKITPGGHWMGITQIATKKANFNFIQTIDTYAKVSITMADAFISCWDEKWRSNVIRPETVINEFVDENWKPLLQTPPFPEYTSGHSVVSGAASTMLTEIIGDHFEYNDTSELEYGLPTRHFKSFKQAANEAAISRLYGGIHYMPSIKNGLKQGRNIGAFIGKKINTQ